MQDTINRASPALGAAIGYFVIKLWAIPNGHVNDIDAVEASLMAGVLASHLVMEFKIFIKWVGTFFTPEEHR